MSFPPSPVHHFGRQGLSARPGKGVVQTPSPPCERLFPGVLLHSAHFPSAPGSAFSKSPIAPRTTSPWGWTGPPSSLPLTGSTGPSAWPTVTWVPVCQSSKALRSHSLGAHRGTPASSPSRLERQGVLWGLDSGRVVTHSFPCALLRACGPPPILTMFRVSAQNMRLPRSGPGRPQQLWLPSRASPPCPPPPRVMIPCPGLAPLCLGWSMANTEVAVLEHVPEVP